MNGDHPDPPTPHPDQETIDAWRASAEAEDHARIREQDAEEAHAKATSRATRILGMLVIGGVMMQFIATFTRQDIDLGGAIYLIAGILILKGKQAGVRFVAFVGILNALTCIFQLIKAQFHGQPVETRSGWRSFADFRLWVEYISPAVFFSAVAILAFAVLRHRQLPYWTKAVKASSVAAGTIMVVLAIKAVARDRKNDELCRRFPAEIKEAERHVTSIIGTVSPGRFPALYSLVAYSTPTSTVHHLVRSQSLPPGHVQKATHFIKLPSGEWRKLELGLIVNDAP